MSPEQRALETRKTYRILLMRSRATYLLLRGDERAEARKYLWGHAVALVDRLGLQGVRRWQWEWRVKRAPDRDADTGRWL